MRDLKNEIELEKFPNRVSHCSELDRLSLEMHEPYLIEDVSGIRRFRNSHTLVVQKNGMAYEYKSYQKILNCIDPDKQKTIEFHAAKHQEEVWPVIGSTIGLQSLALVAIPQLGLPLLIGIAPLEVAISFGAHAGMTNYFIELSKKMFAPNMIKTEELAQEFNEQIKAKFEDNIERYNRGVDTKKFAILE